MQEKKNIYIYIHMYKYFSMRVSECKMTMSFVQEMFLCNTQPYVLYFSVRVSECN